MEGGWDGVWEGRREGGREGGRETSVIDALLLKALLIEIFAEQLRVAQAHDAAHDAALKRVPPGVQPLRERELLRFPFELGLGARGGSWRVEQVRGDCNYAQSRLWVLPSEQAAQPVELDAPIGLDTLFHDGRPPLLQRDLVHRATGVSGWGRNGGRC